MANVEYQLSPGQVIEPEEVDPQEEGWRENHNAHMICPECKEYPPNLTEEVAAGDTVCASCGLVLQSHVIDTRSEWRKFNNDDGKNDDPSRVGAAPDALHDDVPLISEISGADIKGNAHGLLRAQRAMNATTKKTSHQDAFDKIDAYATAGRLPPNVARTACALFKEVHTDKALRSKSQDSLIAGCLILASRQHNAERAFTFMHELTGVPKKDIGRIFKLINAFFVKHNAKKKSKVVGGMVMETQDFTQTQFSGAQGLCAGYASQMGLDSVIQSLSVLIAERIDASGVLSGRSPLSITGACIYAASHLMGQGRTPREIAKVTGAGDSTIKAVYKDIFAHRAELFDEEWLKARGSDLSALPP